MHVEVACELDGLRITRELRSGTWELDGWGRRVVVREWTWAERRRLLEACRRAGRLDQAHFVAGLVALCCDPPPPRELWSLYAHVILDVFGIDGVRGLAKLAAAERLLAERFNWEPARIDSQSAVDLDRLLAELEPARRRAPRSPQALQTAEPGWRRIMIDDGA